MSMNARYVPTVVPNLWSGQGWQDYLAGRPFPREYESWDEVRQRHYERGRLRAAGAPLRYDAVPAREPADVNERLRGLGLIPPKDGKSARRRARR